MASGNLLGEYFVTSGLITEEQLDQAMEKQRNLKSHNNIGDVLVSMGLLSERDKVISLGKQWGVPYVDLSEHEIDPAAVRCISQEIARRFKVIPISKTRGRLVLAMKNPLDIYAIDEIRLISGLDVEPMIATEEDILGAISDNFKSNESVTDAVADVIRDIDSVPVDQIDLKEMVDDEPDVSIEELKELSEEAPIIKLANMIIAHGIDDKASDIHIEPGKDRMKVRYRIDGIMQDGLSIPRKVQASLTSRIKIMAEMDIAEKRAPQDGRISLTNNGRQYDFRVSTLPSVYGEKIVMRILDKGSLSMGLGKLGLLPDTLEDFEKLISRSYGIILVTGPTGSGKSTTLYSVLNKVNSGEKNILTIEDPVEYELEGVTQTQVNVKAGMTFASGLRTMLRQDPDIIMVGEIRDRETGMIAVEAALTGHLVLSTLHTNDAPGATTRLMDMGVEPFLISSTMVGVLAQRLLRVICPKCKESYNPPIEAIRRLGINQDDKPIEFYRGRGCEYCKGTGYKGRIGVYELMTMNDEIRELILQHSSSYQIRQAAIRSGMKSLRDDAMEKILLGITTLEESLRVIYSG